MEYADETYGQHWAEGYDDMVDQLSRVQTGPAVDKLAELVGDGRLLELAIGTGRIAIPLAQRGVQVHGVDASEEMVARMRAKDGGADIPVTMGDMSQVPVEGRFGVIALVFNTIFALRTQEAQVELFANVADHLTDDGVFVIECWVPALDRLVDDEVHGLEVAAERVQIDVATTDRIAQTRTIQRVTLTEAGGIELRPLVLRYAWPAELDLMARLAGLELRDRWAGWNDEPFTSSSGGHVSVYGRAA